MNAHRRTGLGLTFVATMAATGLLVAGQHAGSSTTQAAPGPWNPMEHLAHVRLAEARQQQPRSIDHEHQAHRAPVAGVVPATPEDPCAATLAQVVDGWGHFSDARETYLLEQAPCIAR